MTGRPRLFDRDVALDSAMREFWAEGFDGVTTAKLAQKLGINQPSLYGAFGSKTDLFDEAAQLYIRGLDDALRADLAHSSIREVAKALFRSAVIGFTRDDAPHGCLVMREPRLATRREQTREAIRHRFEAGIVAGEFGSTADAEDMAEYVNSVLAGLAARALEGATRSELESVARIALSPVPLDH
ncbi:TetR/AcrR family transcriptional regulator [Conyzicola nivalis]|uniref:TetR family transcriptional regulator n=1 Tax=Conyzicola nivalis TaxID=1477021 RepID=A0A916SI40_9MICO|nr:TetR/AcrR family transcriptional regulator [Conyzicola nivalis]GGB00501.1 TetR family transcriptional regulator [Conyzicola nivalis]